MMLQGVGKPSGCKLIRFTAVLEGQVIKEIQIRGDFFAIPEEVFEALEASLCGTSLDALEERFAQLARELDLALQGISGSGLAELVQTAYREGQTNNDTM
uniref:Uncharacterized protein n=1 Tax=Gracilinema caldarium TaxID=215591 RepID=A0A7C3EAE5_9SPIR